MTKQKRMKGWTLDAIKSANAAAGRYFFSDNTMSFFKSRPSEIIHEGEGGVYFVDSVKYPDGGRRYHVRPFDPETGHVGLTLGVFETGRVAHKRAEYLAEHGPDDA